MKILLTGARELRCAGARLNAVVTPVGARELCQLV